MTEYMANSRWLAGRPRISVMRSASSSVSPRARCTGSLTRARYPSATRPLGASTQRLQRGDATRRHPPGAPAPTDGRGRRRDRAARRCQSASRHAHGFTHSARRTIVVACCFGPGCCGNPASKPKAMSPPRRRQSQPHVGTPYIHAGREGTPCVAQIQGKRDYAPAEAAANHHRRWAQIGSRHSSP